MLKSLVAILFMCSLSASAIVIRHDVDPELYLAEKTDFLPLATFYFDGAHGTLIDPKWIVTAAHATFCIHPNRFVHIGTKLHKVKRIYIHEAYKPGHSHDIALIELVKPVAGVLPASRYLMSDEQDKGLWFIGIGGTGNGKTGQTIDSYQNKQTLRKAQNTVSEAFGPLLKFKFDEGASALPLEGVSGGGDSGGPAYYESSTGPSLFGISSRFEGSGIGKYGITEIYTRVSYFNTWIDNVMRHQDSAPKILKSLPASHLPAGLNQSNLSEVCTQIGLSPQK
ncbi:peptidase S1 [Pseudoalteromonas luteoviolacea]|uniref:Peptidase S1 n=1 Tax=Pseudoalteromonas luteoviolacea TaxID=43657 RepID=A0A1C0TTY4_9GAMM|nr:trypsin-like serine protease [Pseudoalteromonas luteoviolacea]OCQ22768.1 peptidase S1 [Pseudoalteromonas luteoviolacea]